MFLQSTILHTVLHNTSKTSYPSMFQTACIMMLEPIPVSRIIGRKTSYMHGQSITNFKHKNSFHTWFTPPQTIDSNHVCTKPTHSPFSSLSRPLCVPKDHIYNNNHPEVNLPELPLTHWIIQAP